MLRQDSYDKVLGDLYYAENLLILVGQRRIH